MLEIENVAAGSIDDPLIKCDVLGFDGVQRVVKLRRVYHQDFVS
jgi:hypothetical protein